MPGLTFTCAIMLFAFTVFTPYSAQAFIGSLNGIGKATGQAFEKTGKKIEQNSQQLEKKSQKKENKNQVIQPVKQTATEIEETNQISGGNKEEMKEEYQILNGQNDNIQNNKGIEILH